MAWERLVSTTSHLNDSKRMSQNRLSSRAYTLVKCGRSVAEESSAVGASKEQDVIIWRGRADDTVKMGTTVNQVLCSDCYALIYPTRHEASPCFSLWKRWHDPTQVTPQ